jgi:RNA-directed DNA polymerase
MSLVTPASVQMLQTALHAKAKGSPDFRFYATYDKVYRKDILAFAYECCKANGGAQELKSRIYRPLPVRRVYIPKPDGKQRPLGIPTVNADCTGPQFGFGMGGDLSSVSPTSRPAL